MSCDGGYPGETCVKCGGCAGNVVFHRPNRFGLTGCMVGLARNEWYTHVAEEHLHCICTRCGYDWAVAALDAAVAE